MTTGLRTHSLTGCAPIPLAYYLKALGILRLVAQQADPEAHGWWAGDVFHLRTTLDRDGLRDFFLNTYRPTPIIAPWNGGSGFYPKDNQASIKALGQGQADRIASYRRTIATCRDMLAALERDERPDGDAKDEFLVACRGQLADEAVAWLDAAFVMTEGGPKYPPLLGTGGNDGRLDFTNNFMQRLLDLFDAQSGLPTPSAASWWEDACFSRVQDDLQGDSILGQFDPGAADRPVNPWDYVLMLEGAILFAASAVKRLEAAARGSLSYPFCVRSTGIGYGSASAADEASSHDELWLPLWSRACGLPELMALFSEGRAQVQVRNAKSGEGRDHVQGRTARTGVDFARAISTLGTDRGIGHFTRIGFQARNGKSYLAVPLGRFKVEPQSQVNLLAEIDDWLDSFRRAASNDKAPASANRALRRLETAILDLCQRRSASRLQAVLIALGEAEGVLAVSTKWRGEAFQRPVPLLSPAWLTECDDLSPEFRLAASLAGIQSPSVGSLRQHLEPIEIKGRWPQWADTSEAACNVVWNQRQLEDNLIAVVQRRSIWAMRNGDVPIVFPGESNCSASLGDVAMFLRGETDNGRIESLVRGLILLDWTSAEVEKTSDRIDRRQSEQPPDATFALLKLCHSAYPIGRGKVRVPLEPTIAHLLTAERLDDATRLAARRLLGSNLSPAIKVAARGGRSARRIAAALLFPLSEDDTEKLEKMVLKTQPDGTR